MGEGSSQLGTRVKGRCRVDLTMKCELSGAVLAERDVIAARNVRHGLV